MYLTVTEVAFVFHIGSEVPFVYHIDIDVVFVCHIDSDVVLCIILAVMLLFHHIDSEVFY